MTTNKEVSRLTRENVALEKRVQKLRQRFVQQRPQGLALITLFRDMDALNRQIRANKRTIYRIKNDVAA